MKIALEYGGKKVGLSGPYLKNEQLVATASSSARIADHWEHPLLLIAKC